MSFDKKKYINANYDKFLLKLKITEKELLTLLNKFTVINPKFTERELKALAYFALHCHENGPILSKKRVKSFVRNLDSQRNFLEQEIRILKQLLK